MKYLVTGKRFTDSETEIIYQGDNLEDAMNAYQTEYLDEPRLYSIV